MHEQVMGVDPAVCRHERLRHAIGATQISRPDTVGEPVTRAVHRVYYLLLFLESQQERHRPEDLFFGRNVLRRAREDSWLYIEPAFLAGNHRVTTFNQRLCALGLGLLQVT